METILKMENITKLYKGQKALNAFNINIERGDIYGFVGENGSGKTTVIRIVSGLIYQNAGTFELFGIKHNDDRIHEARKKVGAIVEAPSIYLNMSAKDNLKMQCSLLGASEEKIPSILKDVGLENMLNNDKTARNYSLGMRQRLGIAMALVGEPEFLMLDEPMNGLDPAGIVDIRELIIRLNHEKNITFLISSHILTELSLVATKYGIISRGHMIKEISSKQLEYESRNSVTVLLQDIEKLKENLVALVDPSNIEEVDGGLKIYEVDINIILELIHKAKIVINGIRSSEANIENYYLSVVGGHKHA